MKKTYYLTNCQANECFPLSHHNCRPNIKYQYSALDSGNGVVERSPRERAAREKALNATQEWVQQSNGRYEVIAHLDEIGSRHGKNWFLVTDSSVSGTCL